MTGSYLRDVKMVVCGWYGGLPDIIRVLRLGLVCPLTEMAMVGDVAGATATQAHRQQLQY